MKRFLLYAWLICLGATICLMFWYWDYAYNLPAQKPEKYAEVPIGRHISLPLKFDNNKPVFLHFFNPGCPCSRFNIPHFKSLVRQYGQNVNFAIVIMTNDKSYTAKRIREKYDVNIPILADSALAAATGVYSTPQAVILDTESRLYYRGNYNISRYCTNKQTNFAQISLDSLLRHAQTPSFGLLALRAYGCQLPLRNKN